MVIRTDDDKYAIMRPLEGPAIPVQQFKNGHAQPIKIIAAAPLPFVSFVDMKLDLEDRSLIHGWLGTGAMSVLYGDSNTGKTFLALDMALHVALGWEWRGRRVRQGAVLYIAGEGAYGIQNRVAAFRQHYNIAADEDVPFAVIPSPVDLRSQDALTDRLIATINEVMTRFDREVVLVNVDTLSRALAGGNENDSADMGAYVMNIDRVRDACKAHILSVHHSGKDAAKGARGHSLLRAAVDTELEITKDEISKISTVRVAKQRDISGDGEEVLFNLRLVTLGYDTAGNEVVSCVTAASPVTSKNVTDRAPLRGAGQLAYTQLLNCMSEAGRPAPADSHYPHGAVVVKSSLWLEYLKKAGVVDSEAKNPRVPWQRIRETLIEHRYIGIWGEFVWIVQP